MKKNSDTQTTGQAPAGHTQPHTPLFEHSINSPKRGAKGAPDGRWRSE